MKNKPILSKRSREFLENLRIYLFSNGKKEMEIQEIMDELETHLIEAEKEGKSIENVVGKSPKAYMEMISKEMDVDYKAWVKYICLIILGSFSFIIFTDVMNGNLSYSILEIIGHIFIVTIFLMTIVVGFKSITTMKHSTMKRWFLIFSIGILPMVLYVGLRLLDKIIETPLIQFGYVGSLIIVVVTTLFLIGMSIWAKTWLLMIILALLTIPDYVLSLTPLQYETQLIISSIATLGGLIIYLGIWSMLEKSKIK